MFTQIAQVLVAFFVSSMAILPTQVAMSKEPVVQPIEVRVINPQYQPLNPLFISNPIINSVKTARYWNLNGQYQFVAQLPDLSQSRILSVTLPGWCLMGYYLYHVPNNPNRIDLVVNGPNRNCPSTLEVSAEVATVSLHNAATNATVVYPVGTVLTNNKIKGFPIAFTGNPKFVANWTLPYMAQIADDIGFVLPGQGAICHHQWTMAADRGNARLFVYVGKDQNCSPAYYN